MINFSKIKIYKGVQFEFDIDCENLIAKAWISEIISKFVNLNFSIKKNKVSKYIYIASHSK